ncbi:hypothetical protein K435DRAFT_811442 [Dendrothele bispora CBS 962.96]|uniref:DUF6532 domain-containing protein n=1 Tax=Dendrothele bispora (strain CBS 962.96) TaxID=1314807 RepID=A0A4V4HBA0_DENBC|nr:hypothetical protein K435DRAFT_811442 [Dendrothele bispora CBS 962.96]
MSQNTRRAKLVALANSKQQSNAQPKRKDVPDAPGPPSKKKKTVITETQNSSESTKKGPQKSHSARTRSRAQKRSQAPEDSDKDCQIESESEGDFLLVTLKPKNNKNSKAPVQPAKSRQPTRSREALEDTEEDESGGSNGEMSDDNCSADEEAVQLLEAEAPVVFTAVDDAKQSNRQYRSSSRTSTYSDDLSIPPATDTDGGFTDFNDEYDEPIDATQKRRPSATENWDIGPDLSDDEMRPEPQPPKSFRRRAQKLRSEVINQPSSSDRSATAEQPVATSNTAVVGTDNGPWLVRTRILTVLKGRTTVLASLNVQSKYIRDLFDLAIKVGKLDMMTGSRYCPVNSELKSLADAALTSACERLGFTENNDILDRLRDGDYNTYAKVLITYVAHRIGMERKDLKTTQTATVLASFGFNNDMEDRTKAQQLLLNYTYHYACLPSGSHDNSKPFEHPVVSRYIGAMFFGNNTYSKLLATRKDVFVSSVPQKAEELELPPGLVALSVAAVILYFLALSRYATYTPFQIHAILQDYSRSCNENFPSKELAGVWKTALAILDNIKKVNKLRYHSLMHKLYISASGALPLAQHGLTNEQILNAVDWAALAEAPTDRFDTNCQ